MPHVWLGVSDGQAPQTSCVREESPMNIQTAHSNRPSAREAAGELKAGLQALVPKMVLFFSSSTYPPEDVAGEITAAFPGAAVFGCTTAGEIISGQMLKNSRSEERRVGKECRSRWSPY